MDDWNEIDTPDGKRYTKFRLRSGELFYRVRSVEGTRKDIESNPDELFHIPLSKKALTNNERFSLAGFPSLYLATMLPLAWQESSLLNQTGSDRMKYIPLFLYSFRWSVMPISAESTMEQNAEYSFRFLAGWTKISVKHLSSRKNMALMTKYLNGLKGEKATVGDGYKKYFKLEIYEDDGTIICARERTEVIQEEINLCGYFVIVTSRQMTAEEALELYKSRDVSEKLFRGDKSYLGNRSLRVQSDEAANAKIFVEFVALIVRSRMYVMLKDEVEKLDKKPNYMTVPAAIHELEKIELVRQTDGKYRMDHAVTAKVALFQGTDKELFRDRKEFTGSILKQLEDVYQFIDLVNKTKATFSGLNRSDRRDYPEEAVREALLNSIVHRDYSFSGSNLVNVYEDRIEFVSLGGLVSGLELKSIFLGVSQSRNPNLAAVFYRMRLIESYGTGIGKIERVYKTNQSQPVFETAKGVFRVTLPNRNEEQIAEIQPDSGSESEMSLSKQKDLIIQYAKENGSITRKEVEDLIGAGTTKAFRLLKELCEANRLEQKGNGKLSTYVIK